MAWQKKTAIALGILMVQKMESIMGATSSGSGPPVMWLMTMDARSLSEIYTLPALMQITRMTKQAITERITPARLPASVLFMVFVPGLFSIRSIYQRIASASSANCSG